jgi:hypothetical protein
VKGKFAKGQSGNPAGKPLGARHKATLAIEALFEGEAEAIGRKVIERALEGDPTALRLAVERVAPLRRGRVTNFDLPVVKNGNDVVAAIGAVLQAIAAGQLTPDEGVLIGNVLEVKRRSIELVELEARLRVLEENSVLK